VRVAEPATSPAAAGSPTDAIIEHGQLPGYPRLQAFQQHHRPGQRRVRHWIAEDLADHHRDLPGLLATRRAHLLGGAGVRDAVVTMVTSIITQRRPASPAAVVRLGRP